VGRRPLGPGGDFAILTEMVDFQAELAPRRREAEIVVRIIVRIVRERGADVVATRTFAAREPAASLDDLDLAEAFDAATGRVMSEFTVWIDAGRTNASPNLFLSFSAATGPSTWPRGSREGDRMG
jgi:cholesterol transport system auxiliary component